MMAYAKDKNPQRRRSPVPRPDIAIFRQGALVGLLDAKYRDLWNNPLPRDMLYQLAIYALSQPSQRIATILYPTVDGRARDQVVEISDPMHTANLAQIVLRPVHLPSLADSIHLANVEGERKRRAFASALIDGHAG
jgi:5-methylcytosine-specific restriction enzyme subunit McrC